LKKKSQMKAIYDLKQSYTLMVLPDSGSAAYRITLSAFFIRNFVWAIALLVAASIILLFSWVGLHANYIKALQALYSLKGTSQVQRGELASINLLRQSVEEKMVYVDLLETKILKLIETEGNETDPVIAEIDAKLKELDKEGLYGVADPSLTSSLSYYTFADGIDDLDITSDLSQLALQLEQKESLIETKEKSFAKLETVLANESDYSQCYPDFAPCYGVITDYMGYRTQPRPAYHKGIDIANSKGTLIHAAGRGTVIFAGYMGDYGYLVKIDHGYGFITYYAHNSQLLVSTGDKVEKGDVISLMGSTGYSTGNHCHFEVHENGELRNPMNFVTIVRSPD